MSKIYPLAQARAALADGRYAALTGDHAAANFFRRALEAAAQCGMPWESLCAERLLEKPAQLQPATVWLRQANSA